MDGFAISSDGQKHIERPVEELPPHNLGAERAFVGTLVYDNRAFADVPRDLEPGHFYDADLGTLYAAMREIILAGDLASPITMKGVVRPDLVTLAGQLVSDVTSMKDVAQYARTILDASARRQTIVAGEGLAAAARDMTLPLPDALRATAAELAIVRGGIGSGEVPVISRRVADIEAVPIRWLWPDRFAQGKLSIIAGEPGVGKSQLTANMAGIVTTGGTWPDKTRAPKGAAIFISCEDDAADTIRPRLEAAGADLDRVHVLDWVITNAGQKHFDIGQHVGELTALMQRIGDVRLVVIDPISAFMGAADSHVVSEVRQALWPLQSMAAEMGPAVVLVSHLNKSSSANGAMARVAGSGAFVAATRGAWLVGKDPVDETKRRRVLTPLKTNIGKDDTTGFAFAVESWQRDDIQTSRIVWEAGTVTVSAEDLLRPATHHDDGGAVAEAEMFLRAELTDGPKPSSWVDQAAKQAGISKRAIERARKQLGIAATKDSQGRWHISLPPSARKH